MVTVRKEKAIWVSFVNVKNGGDSSVLDSSCLGHQPVRKGCGFSRVFFKLLISFNYMVKE